MKTAIRMERLKASFLKLGITVVIGTALSLALYIPLWNHNEVFLVIVELLAGAQFAHNATKHGWGRAFRSVAGNLVMLWAVWNHHLPLIVITALAFAIFGMVKLVKKWKFRF